MLGSQLKYPSDGDHVMYYALMDNCTWLSVYGNLKVFCTYADGDSGSDSEYLTYSQPMKTWKGNNFSVDHSAFQAYFLYWMSGTHYRKYWKCL